MLLWIFQLYASHPNPNRYSSLGHHSELIYIHFIHNSNQLVSFGLSFQRRLMATEEKKGEMLLESNQAHPQQQKVRTRN